MSTTEADKTVSNQTTSAGCERNHEGQKVCDCVRVVELERRVWRLERALIEKDDIIVKLRAENRNISAELLEVHLQKVRWNLWTLDKQYCPLYSEGRVSYIEKLSS